MSDSPDIPAFETPTFAELSADPEIAVLLDFTPVPRKVNMPGGWTAAVQREFIARLAHHGSPAQACREVDKHRSGANKLYLSPHGESFRAAWDAAVELAFGRNAGSVAEAAAMTANLLPPSIEQRCKRNSTAQAAGPLPGPREGQVMNELGEWEDEEGFRRRTEDAKDNICGKLIRIRRMFLQEISGCPGKRAAFEILTELPIDWDKAERGEAQADEPYHNENQRQPDMVLLAESGWSWGDIGYGPKRMAAARKAIDDHRAAAGKPPIDWSAED